MIATVAVSASLVISGSSTAYHFCDGSTTMTASGRTVQIGYVANNSLPLGSWVEMKRPRLVMNRRYFKVMDRGGPGFVLDFWAPSCEWMNSWGRRSVSFRAVPRKELFRGKPIGGWKVVAARRGGKLVWRPR
jgi:3D (Asp-Asp-Asp) domain-containing protein